MKFHPNYIEIQANGLLHWWSRLNGTGGKAKASAFYPFILTTSNINPNLREAFINHELIHFAQQREMLLLGAWVLWATEGIYWRIIKGKSAREAYVLRSIEQEAYDHMFDLNYLSKRPHFNHLRNYWRHKPVSWDSLIQNNLQHSKHNRATEVLN